MIATYPQAAPAAWAWSASSPKDERRPTIVMIEDDAGIAEMYRRQLTVDGFRVLIAGDGMSGLELVRSARPNLVLLDILLPELEGFGVLERMRQDPALAAIPVVVLSNYGEPDMERRGRAGGAVDYLIKSSTTPTELSARIRRWLTSKTDD